MTKEPGSYLLLPPNGYAFGVEAGPSVGGTTELHGGFRSFTAAAAAAEALRREYDDYEYVKVVRIETPEAAAA